jgi:hypothetical protein
LLRKYEVQDVVYQIYKPKICSAQITLVLRLSTHGEISSYEVTSSHFVLEAFGMNCLQFEEDEGLSVQLLVDHAGKDAHHSGTALVELLGAKDVLFLVALVTEESNGDHGSTKVLK